MISSERPFPRRSDAIYNDPHDFNRSQSRKVVGRGRQMPLCRKFKDLLLEPVKGLFELAQMPEDLIIAYIIFLTKTNFVAGHFLIEMVPWLQNQVIIFNVGLFPSKFVYIAAVQWHLHRMPPSSGIVTLS